MLIESLVGNGFLVAENFKQLVQYRLEVHQTMEEDSAMTSESKQYLQGVKEALGYIKPAFGVALPLLGEHTSYTLELSDHDRKIKVVLLGSDGRVQCSGPFMPLGEE